MALRSVPKPELYQFKVFIGKSPMSDTPSVTVPVDDGYLIVGGGAKTSWTDPQPGNLLVSCYPIDRQHWFASSKAHSVGSPAELYGFAIAIKDTGKLDVQYFTRESPVSDQPSSSVSVANGYVLTGGGAQVRTNSPVGQLLTATFPSDARTWEARSKAHTVSCPGSIIAYAIGVKGTGGNTFPPVTIKHATAGPAEHPEVTVQIEPGDSLTGGGALVEPLDPTIGNLLVESAPMASGWSARSKSHSTPCQARITAYALGIRQ